MVPVPVFCRMALICVRTVEIFTPCSRAISAGVTPRPSAASTRVSAAVSSWLRAKHCRKVFAHARTPQQQRRHAGLHRYQRGQLTIVALAQGQQPAQAALRRVVQCVLQMRHRARVAGAQPVVRELQALPGAQRVPRAVVQVHHLAVVGEQDDAEIHLVQRPRQQGAR